MSAPSSHDAALFLFAHQDDEIAAATRILAEQRDGVPVLCAFRTDRSRGGNVATRDAESRRALAELGVQDDAIFFIGSEERIEDGELMNFLEGALSHLRARMSDRALARIYTLALEGGHHDHDAAHLVAAAFAVERNLVSGCFELPLYNSHHTLPPLFRAFSPLPPWNEWKRRTISLREGWKIFRLTWIYRSQRRAWLALSTGAAIQLLLWRREVMRRVSLERLTQRPHRGPLFYEQRFGVAHEEFAAKAGAFIEKHISRPVDLQHR
jgi:LmbE family N-acetylglucosaminyl deacetylase